MLPFFSFFLFSVFATGHTRPVVFALCTLYCTVYSNCVLCVFSVFSLTRQQPCTPHASRECNIRLSSISLCLSKDLNSTFRLFVKPCGDFLPTCTLCAQILHSTFRLFVKPVVTQFTFCHTYSLRSGCKRPPWLLLAGSAGQLGPRALRQLHRGRQIRAHARGKHGNINLETFIIKRNFFFYDLFLTLRRSRKYNRNRCLRLATG